MANNTSTQSQNKSNEPKANAWALLPMGVFLIIYIGMVIAVNTIPVLHDYFDAAPIVPAFVIALIFALQQNRKVKFQDKLGIVGRGIGDSSIIYMILIFILAGIFAGTVGVSSAASVAYCFLDFIPGEFAVLVIFIVSCLVSLAMGTSVGSITLMTPIAISVASVSGQDLSLCVAVVICGSMFGDNLSMISDTCIAACTGLGCEPKEKFSENAKIVVPAALITIVLIIFFSINSGNGNAIHEGYNLIQFIPYVIVLVLSLCGVNVCIVLAAGIICGIAVDVFVNNISFAIIVDSMQTGVSGMYEIIFITILVASISQLIKENGGFTFVLDIIRNNCKTKKVAQLSTAIMVSIIDLITANNTVAIVVSAPIAKEVSKSYNIRRRRMASIIDTFSCIIQGILPYGAQMMIAVSMCNRAEFTINAFDIMPLCWYQYILCIIVLVFIFTGLSDIKPTWAIEKAKNKISHTIK